MFDPLTIRKMLDDFGLQAFSELMDCFANDVAKVEVGLSQFQLDQADVARMAHSMKGTAAMFGARDLSQEASKLEKLCRESKPGDLTRQIERVRDTCRSTIAETENFRRVA